MHRVIRLGGEGVMARKPGSGYAPDFRTEKLLKFKPAIVAAVPA
jgi:ATP-dependent DNA ligase